MLGAAGSSLCVQCVAAHVLETGLDDAWCYIGELRMLCSSRALVDHDDERLDHIASDF